MAGDPTGKVGEGDLLYGRRTELPIERARQGDSPRPAWLPPEAPHRPAPLEERLVRFAARVLPGRLWGHGVRSLVANPVFALLPWLYLELAAGASDVVALIWLGAFLLGYPHAAYTALEFKHWLLPHDGVADGRKKRQLLFFGAYGCFGLALSGWYVAAGGAALSARLGLPLHPTMAMLALGGALGAAVGLQDVLVLDLLVRPRKVLRAALAALLTWRWLRLTLPWTLMQFALGEVLVSWF